MHGRQYNGGDDEIPIKSGFADCVLGARCYPQRASIVQAKCDADDKVASNNGLTAVEIVIHPCQAEYEQCFLPCAQVSVDGQDDRQCKKQ